MINGILGRKIGMTGIYQEEGKFIPVTVIEAGPCFVTQIKNKEKDSYNAVQISFQEQKGKHTNKALKGHFKKIGESNFKFLREFNQQAETIELGQKILASDVFKVGEKIVVAGVSKGRGFAGVIKRHGFHGGRATHGSHSHRIPGSIGACASPSKVIKGKKMPGHYGVERKSILNLKIVDLKLDDNLIFVKGAVPGPKNGLLELRKR